MENKNILNKMIIILLLLFISLSITSCNKNNNPDDTDKPIPDVVHPIGLDLSNQKTNYNKEEQLDTSDLIATVKYSDNTSKIVTDQVIIDSSKYNNKNDGTYEIIVSYKENDYIAKSFYFAVVGTGKPSEGEDENPDDNPTVFGAGTYKFDAAIDLASYLQNALIVDGCKFANGYFVVKGIGTKRANATAFAMELVKNEGTWIEFNVTGTATISISCSSTGSSNTSAIALFDSENELVVNNENITTVTSTNAIILTYSVPTGTYRILSQSKTSYSTRGVRVYSVTVTQK